MKNYDYSKISLDDAIAWTKHNTSHNDVCKRIRSRAVARRLLQHIEYLDTCLAKMSEIVVNTQNEKEYLQDQLGPGGGFL